LKIEGHDFEKRVLQCIKNYEEGQYSYFQLLNIKNVSALHFQLLLMDNSLHKWKSLKRHFFQVEIKRSLPNIKDFFTNKQLHGHLEMVLLLAKIKTTFSALCINAST
jgi:hypothetical protein